MDFFDGSLVLPVGTEITLRDGRKTTVDRIEETLMVDSDGLFVDPTKIKSFLMPFKEVISNLLMRVSMFHSRRMKFDKFTDGLVGTGLLVKDESYLYNDERVVRFVDSLVDAQLDCYLSGSKIEHVDADFMLIAFEQVSNAAFAKMICRLLSEKAHTSVRDRIKVALEN